MNKIKEKIEILKRFIEICDSEIFPKKTICIHVINNSLFDDNNIASYNSQRGNLKRLIYIVFLPLMYVWSLILLKIRKTSESKHTFINIVYLIQILRTEIFNTESYFVNKNKAVLDMTIVHLASIACHEVRHRFQDRCMSKNWDYLELVENGELLSLYKKGRVEVMASLDKPSYKNMLEEEADARCIDFVIKKKLLENFPSGNITTNEFRDFLKQHKDIIKWGNPYLKHK